MRRHPQASAGVRLRQLCAALVGAAGVYALINMHQGLELHQEAVPHSVPRPRTVPVRELRQQARSALVSLAGMEGEGTCLLYTSPSPRD